MTPRISVFLLSHNKGGFAVEAVKSVLAQDFKDWELWVLENSTDNGRTRALLEKSTPVKVDARIRYLRLNISKEIRDSRYVAAWLLNEYYPRATGDFIFYLSDDDLFTPGIFSSAVRYFDEHSKHHALYFGLYRTLANKPGEGHGDRNVVGEIPARMPLFAGRLDGYVDGGQVAYRRQVLDSIGQPYFPDDKDGALARHCDGLHLEKVAKQFVFWPLNVTGVIHRHTPKSTWN